MTSPDTSSDLGDVDDRVVGHYRRLLAANYTWMLGGDIESTAAGQRELLAEGLAGGPRGLAVDLGCGSGAQTLALADLDYAPVLAVDTEPTLLVELRAHTAARPAVETREGDALAVAEGLAPDSVAAAVCMGDTLLHLPSPAAVSALVVALAAALRPGGAVVLTYRDLTTRVEGTDRFIPVRSDDQQIMTCFLDDTDPEIVEIYDIIHSRTDEGWTMAVSSYPKLRLAAAWVRDQLVHAGLEIATHERRPNGMWHTLARRPGVVEGGRGE